MPKWVYIVIASVDMVELLQEGRDSRVSFLFSSLSLLILSLQLKKIRTKKPQYA